MRIRNICGDAYAISQMISALNIHIVSTRSKSIRLLLKGSVDIFRFWPTISTRNEVEPQTNMNLISRAIGGCRFFKSTFQQI